MHIAEKTVSVNGANRASVRPLSKKPSIAERRQLDALLSELAAQTEHWISAGLVRARK